MLVNPDNPNNNDYREELRTAAPGLGLTLQIVTARTDDDLPIAFATALASRAAAILVGADPFLINRRRQIVGLAARHAIPAIYSVRDFVDAGGLVSYSTDPSEVYRQLGIYAGRIIKGEKLANLPVMQPSKFELVINMGAAKALGLTVPPTLLAIADEVIE